MDDYRHVPASSSSSASSSAASGNSRREQEEDDTDPVRLSLAAQLAARHRIMSLGASATLSSTNNRPAQQSLPHNSSPFGASTSTARDPYETDEGDVEMADAAMPSSSKLKKGDSESASDSDFSSDSEYCASMDEEQRSRIYMRDTQQRTVPSRHVVRDHESYEQLREDIASRCEPMPSTSVVAAMMGQREISRWKRGYKSASSSMPERIKAITANNFFPNSRKVVDKQTSKSFCCQYIKNGSELVVASQDEKIRFYERGPKDKYRVKREVQVQYTGWSILDMAISRDGRSLAYGTWKENVYLARLDEPTLDPPFGVSWTALQLPDIETSVAVFSLRFSRDGSEVLCGSSDQSLHVFDLYTKQKLVTINNAHEDDVNTVCYGDVGSHLLYSGGDDGLIKVWDRRSWRDCEDSPVGVFAGHQDGITYIDPRGDNRYLISNSKDQTIKLWDLRKFSTEEAAKETRDCVAGQKWDYRWQQPPKSKQVVLAGDTSVATFRGHSVLHTLIRAKFSPARTGKRYIYTGCARGELIVYDMLTNETFKPLPGHMGVVRDVAWNPESNEIVTCAWDGVSAVWRWDERRARPTCPDSSRMHVELSSDEYFQPIVRRKPDWGRRCKRRKRNAVEDDSDSD